MSAAKKTAKVAVTEKTKQVRRESTAAPMSLGMPPWAKDYGVAVGGPELAAEYRDRIEAGRWRDPFLPLPIMQLSERTQVYIYNAGPFRQVLELGSFGTKYMDGVKPEAFFDAAPPIPLVIPGLPNEVIQPIDGHVGIRQFYMPQRPFEGNPGLGFAVEITKELDWVGVFVTATGDTDSAEWKRAFGRARFLVMRSAEEKLSDPESHQLPDLGIWKLVSGRP